MFTAAGAVVSLFVVSSTKAEGLDAPATVRSAAPVSPEPVTAAAVPSVSGPLSGVNAVATDAAATNVYAADSPPASVAFIIQDVV